MVIKKLVKLQQEYINDPEARGYAAMTAVEMYNDLTEKRYYEYPVTMIDETKLADIIGTVKTGIIMSVLESSADPTHKSVFRLMTKDGVNVNDEDFSTIASALVAAIPEINQADMDALIAEGTVVKSRAEIIGYPNLAQISVTRVKEA